MEGHFKKFDAFQNCHYLSDVKTGDTVRLSGYRLNLRYALNQP